MLGAVQAFGGCNPDWELRMRVGQEKWELSVWCWIQQWYNFKNKFANDFNNDSNIDEFDNDLLNLPMLNKIIIPGFIIFYSDTFRLGCSARLLIAGIRRVTLQLLLSQRTTYKNREQMPILQKIVLILDEMALRWGAFSECYLVCGCLGNSIELVLNERTEVHFLKPYPHSLRGPRAHFLVSRQGAL